MSAIVFAGPSLPPSAAPARPGLQYRPPARQGDVYRAALEGPIAIGLVDGYFESVPSVWHKEVLWALAQGIHVLGASSMGALRAAELHQLGMEGVGFVFELYRDRVLEDDDEVALVHAPGSQDHPDQAYLPVTEAMVNIRATLAAARDAGIVDDALCGVLVDCAKSAFYKARSYPEIIRRAGVELGGEAPLAPFREWLADHRVDAKRDDALELVERVCRIAAAGAPRRAPARAFEATTKWSAMVDRGAIEATAGRAPGTGQGGRDPDRGGGDPDEIEGIAEELRIGALAAPLERAALRAAAREAAARAGESFGEDAMAGAERRLLRRLGVRTERGRATWRAAVGLEPAGFARIVRDEAAVLWHGRALSRRARALLADQLRADGLYEDVAGRARDKRARLAAWGLARPSLAGRGLDEPTLLDWYFRERLGREVPADLEAHALESGFGTVPAMVQAILRERCYLDIVAG